MVSPDSIKALILPELRALVRHQRQGRLRYRLPPSPIYHIIDDVKNAGLELSSMRGPWGVGSVPMTRRSRGGRVAVPTIERGAVLLLIESEDRAAELAGLLNWCEIEESDLSLDLP